MEKKWEDLTPDERQEERFKRWSSPDNVNYINQEAEKSYKLKAIRLINAIQMKQPDRVPVVLFPGFYPTFYAGTTLHKVMYDFEELYNTWFKFLSDFDSDSYCAPAAFPGKALEILDIKTLKWPGHGLPPNALAHQYIESEYMKENEYDAFLEDPSDFYLRVYAPRIFGSLQSFQMLSRATAMCGMAFSGYPESFIFPEVRAAYKKLIDAGEEMEKWVDVMIRLKMKAMESGFPSLFGPVTFAPFDTLGDTLRGTQGIMTDLFRQPDKLLEALERITSLTIKTVVSAANITGDITVFFPLHKGDDIFLSNKQYETFYWPSLKKVILGLINEGLVPYLCAEGRYHTRLDIIKDLPKGKVIWWFDNVDMAKAKKTVGQTCCIAGNVPSSLLITSTPKKVKQYCRELIDTCAENGGYILSGETHIESGNPNNMKAMIEAAKEYGVYK